LKKERDMRCLAFFLGVLTLAGGCVLEDKPVIPEDGGVEAGMCGLCDFETPICNEDTLECVQCTPENDDLCIGSTPICDPKEFICVGCLADADCTAVDAAKCDLGTKMCEPCDSAAQCNDVDGLPGENNACRADGVCVECTPETEAATCPVDKSCNPRTFECTGKEPGSLETCEDCVSDSECGADGVPSEQHRCVPMFYPADERFPDGETGSCLKTTDGGCERPYSTTLRNRQSLSGTPLSNYCGIREDLATCRAVRALELDDQCGDPADCPERGLCEQVGDLLNRCTYRCDAPRQCLPVGNPDNPNPGSTCGSSGSGGSGGSGGEKYCGG
jgi:hypothetical protein